MAPENGWLETLFSDGQNPAPPMMMIIPLFIGVSPSQVVVWDFVHQQYVQGYLTFQPTFAPQDTEGPAMRASAPVRTKIPAPMHAPMPSKVSSTTLRRRSNSPSWPTTTCHIGKMPVKTLKEWGNPLNI